MHVPTHISDQLTPSCTRPTVLAALSTLDRSFIASQISTDIKNPPKYIVKSPNLNIKIKGMKRNKAQSDPIEEEKDTISL